MTREEAINEIKSWDFLEGKEIEAIQVLVPELAESAENKDERIRKDIINYIGFEKPIADKDENRIKKMIVYLERLKEQKTTYWNPTEEDVKLFNKAVITNTRLTPQEKAKLDIIRTKFKHRPYIVTTECIEFDNEFKNQVSHLITSVLNGEHSYSRDFVEWVSQQLLGYAKNEMKTTEWNEEDVEHVNSVIKKLEGICRNQFVSTRFAYSEDIDWLKSLSERFNLKPKQEWSEENERIMESLISLIETIPEYYISNETRNGYVAWLKSLPLNLKKKNEDVAKLCSNEWSEEDETEIKRTIGLIEGWMNTFKETYYATDCKKSISWLKSLRPQPKQEWSEEDELKRDNLVGLVEEIKRQPLKRLEDWDGYINWLKSLPKRFVLQPKQEWSDKDEHILNNIYDFVAENTIDINRARCAKECLDWLKSLRPQQKNELSEENKKEFIINHLVSLGYPINANGNIIKYEEVFEMCKNAMVYWLQQNLQKMIARKMVDSEGIKTQTLLKESYLKAYREGVEDSIRELSSQYNKKSSQPSWKPTEEQIKAIRLARSFVVDDFSEKPTLSETLKELEEQLKKL